LVFIDPYCTVSGTSLQWTIENPGSSNVTVSSWTLDGGSYQPGFTAAPGSTKFTTTKPGSHTIVVYYGDSQSVSDTSHTVACSLPIPNTGAGGELIPVTGADNTVQGLLFGGISTLGLGLVLSALRKFFNL
jgi:hypothetical protein